MSRFLQFWCKLNTRRIVKTCLSVSFFRDYYDDSLDVMFPQFPNHLPPFPMAFPHVSPSVSGCFYCFPTVFPRFLF